MVLCIAWASTSAQATYKCGNAYSETPCVDGKVVTTDDKRTSEQKRQADDATARTKGMVDELQKDRIAREKQEAIASRAANASVKSQKISRTPFKALKPKLAKPEKAVKPVKPVKPIKAAKKKKIIKPAG